MSKDNDENQNEIIRQTLKRIEKDYGKGSVMHLGESSKNDIEKVSTGSLYLDKAIGGGYPKGRIIEIYGPESSGKTSLSFLAASEIQKQNGKVAFIDAEHAIDLNFARKIGVNTNDLILSQPDSGEQALDIAEAIIESNVFDLLIIDSVAALVPEIELKGEMSDQTIGAHARLMSKALRRLTPKISKSKTIVIFINQIREKVGVIFGNPETTTGGRALKFYSSIRVDTRLKERIKDSNNILQGQIIKVKIVKNKVSEPYKEAFIELNYFSGFNKDLEILNYAVEKEIILKQGSWYSYKGEKMGQGKDSALEWFSKNKKKFQEIEKKILEIIYVK